MQMRWHDHETIDTQMLIPDAEVKAVRDDLTGGFIHEYWQPLYNAEGNVVQTDFFFNAIFFHCFPPLETSPLRGTSSVTLSAGSETLAEQ